MRSYKFILLLVVTLAACQAPRPVSDYERFYSRSPKTILVLPVINETTSAEAPAAFVSTIASPLLRRGYVVLPVLPAVDILRSEGIHEGDQVTTESLGAFRELLGADTVLQTTLHSWDTVYLIFASSVDVHMSYRLYDTETAEILWEDSEQQSVQSDSSGHPIAALLNAALTAISVEYVDLASRANLFALRSLPAGPLSVNFEVERDKYLAAEARRKEREAAKAK